MKMERGRARHQVQNLSTNIKTWHEKENMNMKYETQHQRRVIASIGHWLLFKGHWNTWTFSGTAVNASFQLCYAHTHTRCQSGCSKRQRGKTKRKLQDQGKEETTQPVSLLHLTPVELWLGSSRQRWVLILFPMAQGPEAKKMTETCYVASSAWGCGAEWLVSIYKWGF